MQLNDPVHNDSVPTVGGDPPPAPGDRFSPSPLSRTETVFLKQSLERNQLRRRMYHASYLRVCIDGEEHWQCDLGVSVYEPFRVPLSASYIEIFGDDDDGDLLLAVFPLPEPEVVEDDQAQHLYVTLEGGQTVAIEISLGDGTGEKVRAYVIQISYSESTAVKTRRAENPLLSRDQHD